MKRNLIAKKIQKLTVATLAGVAIFAAAGQLAGPAGIDTSHTVVAGDDPWPTPTKPLTAAPEGDDPWPAPKPTQSVAMAPEGDDPWPAPKPTA